jgi:hypothetical protein
VNPKPLLDTVTAYAAPLATLDAYTEARATAEACRALARVAGDPAERTNLALRANWHTMRADALYLTLIAELDHAHRGLADQPNGREE